MIRGSDRGVTIRITVWLLRRERTTWITSAEIAALALVLLTAPGPYVRLGVGIPLLAHLGYKALTSLPLGEIPGKPMGAKAERMNQDLRSNVVGFLNEVRRVEKYAQRARIEGRPASEVEDTLQAARSRMMAAAAAAAKATGRGSETSLPT